MKNQRVVIEEVTNTSGTGRAKKTSQFIVPGLVTMGPAFLLSVVFRSILPFTMMMLSNAIGALSGYIAFRRNTRMFGNVITIRTEEAEPPSDEFKKAA